MDAYRAPGNRVAAGDGAPAEGTASRGTTNVSAARASSASEIKRPTAADLDDRPEDAPVSWQEVFSYKFDQWVASRRSQTIGLLVMGMLQMVVGGMLFFAVSDDGDSVPEEIWTAWTFMADPGTHAPTYGSAQRAVAFLITIGGIFFFAVILGFVVDGIRAKMDALKKGKSKVVESDHILLLGWTDKSSGIIREIADANESEGGGVIVVLDEAEKELLEVELKEQVKKHELMGTRVVFRTGSAMHVSDLAKVSAHTARAIIVLVGGGDPDVADSNCLRIVLSLKGLQHPLRGHIVAEIRDVDNEALVKLVGGEDVETLVSHDIVGRLMLMSARQPGLAKVYTEVLGFDGDEFYMEEWDSLTGTTFGDVFRRVPMAVPIGVAQAEEGGKILLNPPADYEFKEGDKLLVIAEDDDTYEVVDEPVEVTHGAVPTDFHEPEVKEMILFCGWRRDIRDVLLLLDSMVAYGTELHMLNDVPVFMRAKLLEANGLHPGALKNIELVMHYGNTAVRRHLEELPIEEYSSAMILADEKRESDLMHADSHSLATLLLIRDIQRARAEEAATAEAASRRAAKAAAKAAGGSPLVNRDPRNDPRRADNSSRACPIICEILDSRTQKTISSNRSVSLTSDFVQSNTMVSQILAMVAESRDVKVVLDELLGAEGAALNLVNARRYIRRGETATFYDLAARARQFDETLVGFQMHATAGGETTLNPRDKDARRAWDMHDLIVLSGRVDLNAEPEPETVREPRVVGEPVEHTEHAVLDKDTFQPKKVRQPLRPTPPRPNSAKRARGEVGPAPPVDGSPLPLAQRTLGGGSSSPSSSPQAAGGRRAGGGGRGAGARPGSAGRQQPRRRQDNERERGPETNDARFIETHLNSNGGLGGEDVDSFAGLLELRDQIGRMDVPERGQLVRLLDHIKTLVFTMEAEPEREIME